MNLFGGRRKKEQYTLVIEIGSASIDAAIVREREQKKEIIGTVQKTIPFGINIKPQALLRGVTDLLTNALSELFSLRLPLPDNILISLESPWYASQTRDIVYAEEKRFVITKNLLEKLIEREKKAFEKESKNIAFVDLGECEVIASVPLSVKLDGYRAPHAVGKKCGEISISLFIAVAPRDALAQFKKTVERFTQAPISISVVPLVARRATELLFPDLDSYLFLSIGDEVIDMAHVSKKEIIGTASLPLGTHAILRDIAAASKTENNHTLTLLNLYQEKKLLGKQNQIIENALARTAEVFKKNIFQGIGLIARADIVPEHLVVMGSGEAMPWFVNFMRTDLVHLPNVIGKQKVIHIHAALAGVHATIETIGKANASVVLLALVI